MEAKSNGRVVRGEADWREIMTRFAASGLHPSLGCHREGPRHRDGLLHRCERGPALDCAWGVRVIVYGLVVSSVRRGAGAVERDGFENSCPRFPTRTAWPPNSHRINGNYRQRTELREAERA